MSEFLSGLLEGIELTGDLRTDVRSFLEHHHYPKIAQHSLRVGDAAHALAQRFGVNPDSAQAAGYLHDVSVIFPNEERANVARKLGISVLPEEEQFPLIVHQKISKVLAQELFGMTDAQILSAIECHTTLKANAWKIDMVLFVADKIEWDQAGTPPYLAHLKKQLNLSLEHGVFAYINYLWENKANLKVLHPWLEAAYWDLKQKGVG
jgi:predicted HD superfamily hydrolase involved in NAD metabolism